MYKIFKDHKGDLRFTLTSSSVKHDVKHDIEGNVVFPTCNVHTGRIPYTKWVEMNYDIIEDIYHRIINDMTDVTYEYDVPVKIKINTDLFKELLFRRLYKSSYNSYKKTNDIYQ